LLEFNLCTTVRLAAVDTWCGLRSWRPSSVHIQCASTVHDNHYPLSFIPAFNLRTPARAGRASVSQCPATSGPAPREVLPSTSNVAPILDWAGRLPTHASLHPATKPRILATPKPFNLPAESMPIARRPHPRRAASFNWFLCAIPRCIVARARLRCCGTAQRNLCLLRSCGFISSIAAWAN
jgi:hypothetical protein